MRRLTLDKFITLRDVDIDLNGITVLIGPQASGKSLLAKLVYFFNEFATKAIFDAIRDNSKKADLDKNMVSKFKDIFFEDSWKNDSFNISYQYSEFHGITISKVANRTAFKVELLNETKLFFSRGKTAFQKYLSDIPESENHALHISFSKFKFEVLSEQNNASQLFTFDSYIPATRSFFSLFPDNLSSDSSSPYSLDIMSQKFADIYRFSKQIKNGEMLSSIMSKIHKENDKNRGIYALADNISSRILNGEHKIIKGDDYIENDESILRLVHTSSGQQESLPLLTSTYMMTYYWRSYPQNYYVEEPEAHLFPEAQYDIVKYLACLAGCYGKHRYIITTHSPYILSSINNLLYLYQVCTREGGVQSLKENGFDEIVGIDFNTLSAYSVNNGTVTDIIDHDTQLIDAEMIDSVSQSLGDDFDKLLDLMYEE